MDTWIIVAFVLWIVASVLQLIHSIPRRWKGTISIFLALTGIGATYVWADKEIKGEITALVQKNMALIKQDSLFAASQDSMLRSHRLMRLNLVKAVAMHDSILMRISRLDSCIDRHFQHEIDGSQTLKDNWIIEGWSCT